MNARKRDASSQTGADRPSERRRTGIRRHARWVAGLALATAVVAGCLVWWWQPAAETAPLPEWYRPTVPPPARESLVRELCTHCHLFPKPEILPHDAWAGTIWEMVRMSGFGVNVTEPFEPESVIKWFQRRAPERLELPRVKLQPLPRTLSITRHLVRWPDEVPVPFVSNIRLASFSAGGPPEIVVSDMRSGRIGRVRRDRTGWQLEQLARVDNPGRVRPADLDQDGRVDLVVADLGSFNAMDHNLGRVVWLRQQRDGSWQQHVLAEGLGRVSDVYPADMDADGDTDLVVAEFGWRATGHLLLMENFPGQNGEPTWVTHQIDGHHGATEICVTDVDADGRLDVLVLYSQEHELVRCYLNRGEHRFEFHDLYRAPYPAWGYCSMQLVDLDQDGDQDLLLANGDMLDNGLLKPFHGIQWLENQGGLQYEAHQLALVPGVFRAEAGDVDGDGDVDVVGCALTSPQHTQQVDDPQSLVSMLWLEQTAPRQFVARRFPAVEHPHPTLAVADMDGDGDVDVLVGNGEDDTGLPSDLPAIEVWENQSR